MADESNLNPEASRQTAENMKTAAERVKDFSRDAEESNQALGSMARHMANIARGSNEFQSEIKGAESLVKNVSKQAADIAKFTADDLADKKKTEKLLQRQQIVKGNIQAIESKIAVLLEKAANATEEEQIQLNKTVETLSNAVVRSKGLLTTFEQIEETNEDLNDKTSWFDKMNETGKLIPGFGKLFGEFENAANAARKAASEGGDAFSAGAKELAGAAGKAALTGFFTALTKGLKDGQDNITQFSRQLNISREEANKLNLELQKTGRAAVGIIGNELVKANLDLSNALGINARITGENAVAFATMTKQLGMSTEQASNLSRFSASTGESIDEITDRITGTVIAQNAANDTAIKYQEVLKDVADAGAATQLTVSKFPGGLARAAFEARKFGLSLAQLEKSGEGLLNFESSISAELEAELLTGKQLNLERARMAALTGDTATLAKELAANFGSAEEFGKMNVIQQKALAESVGMTRDELAKTLQQEAALDKFKVKTNEELKEEVAKEEKKIKALEKQGKFEEARVARQKLYAKLGDEELGRQRQNQSVQESMAESLAEIASFAQSMSYLLEPVVKAFQSIGQAGSGIFGFLGKAGSKFKTLGLIFSDTIKKNVDTVVKKFGGFVPNLFKSLVKGGGKTGLKSILKKIPVLGLLVGAGMAYKRFKDGDILGGIMEIGSGVASLFPGIGTAISVGIDAATVATDIGGITGEKSQTVEGSIGAAAMTAGWGGISPGGGLLNMVAMSNLQKAVEKSAKASEEAAQAMRDKELTVNMDGRKVNDVQRLAYSKIQ